MNLLRRTHLYLGCFFAPMLLFFAISGIWQVLGWQDTRDAAGKRTASAQFFHELSTAHTGHAFHSGKGDSLTSPYLQGFVIAMAVGLAASIILGTILAFKYGRGMLALLSLLGGVLVPLGLIWLFHS
jgi:hypothetical protein